jgi:predicted nucleic acid-binding protein
MILADTVALDAGPLGKLAHPRADRQIVAWLERLLAGGTRIIIPEIADYEVRRSLRLANLGRSIARLDELKRVLHYSPITTTIMLRAADLWAQARRTGTPTADPRELDGDVILASQAIDAGAVVATENVGHLALFVPAEHWQRVMPAR